ncbi:MAG: hypothetical protein VXV96_12980 [Bdellovibrionota bacterium]|jgi:hypothetical protein|nr:hypothetical protein [Bdellovibrionota bacterium]
MSLERRTSKTSRLIIKKCHVCGTLNEGYKETKKCGACNKSFLPSNYFGKVHALNSKEFDELFSHSDELHEEDLIKGINVLW